MSIIARAVRGAEAGAITAGAIETSFFVLDLVRLRPLATPATLAGAGLNPGGMAVDLTSMSGAAWATYQISMLTLAHFVTFAVAGVLASLAFDWSRTGDAGRFAVLAALCSGASFATVAWSSSVVALGSMGAGLIVGMNLLAAAILGSVMHVLPVPEAMPAHSAETASTA